jgi:hypothetical protein
LYRKQDAAQCLVLSRGGDVLLHGEPSNKGGDVRSSKLTWVPPAMEDDEATDPVNIGILGPSTVVPRPNRCPYLIQ